MEAQRVKEALSVISLISAIVFGILGDIAPPNGEISGSMLILIAQFLTASGTFLGLQVFTDRFSKKLDELKKS